MLDYILERTLGYVSISGFKSCLLNEWARVVPGARRGEVARGGVRRGVGGGERRGAGGGDGGALDVRLGPRRAVAGAGGAAGAVLRLGRGRRAAVRACG